MDKWLSTGLVVALVVVIAILGLPAFRHFRESPPPVQPAIRLSLTAPPGAELGSGEESLDAAVSPNDVYVAFVATTDGTARLWQRTLAGGPAAVIKGTIGARLPAWKQTGNVVAFFTNERLRQVSITDGTVQDLAPARAGAGASWLRDGSLLFAPDARSPIRRLQNGSLSDATQLRPNDRSHTFPMTVGSTNAFVYTAVLTDGRHTIRLADTGREWDLTTTSGHGQLVGDTLLYTREDALMAQRLNPATHALEGRGTLLATDVGLAASGYSMFTASPRLLLTASSAPRPRQLTWFTTDGRRTGVARDPSDYWQVRLSHDDRYAAVTASTPLLRTLDILVIPMSETGNVDPVTRSVAADSDPVWSSDGSRLLFRSLQDGQPRLFTRSVRDTDAEDEIVRTAKVDDTATDWRDDERVLVQGPAAGAGSDVWALSIATGTREAVATTSFNETDARFSPDGRWIAYVSDESGRPDIYAARSSDGQRIRVSFAGGTRPRWGRDNRTLFFQRGSAIMRADASSPTQFATPRMVIDAPGIRDFDLAHRSDALIALLPTSDTTTAAISALIDWQTLVPAVQP